MKIRRGINKKNFDYWKNEVYIGIHGEQELFAELKAHRVCHEQEIEILKQRIIKIERKLIK